MTEYVYTFLKALILFFSLSAPIGALSVKSRFSTILSYSLSLPLLTIIYMNLLVIAPGMSSSFYLVILGIFIIIANVFAFIKKYRPNFSLKLFIAVIPFTISAIYLTTINLASHDSIIYAISGERIAQSKSIIEIFSNPSINTTLDTYTTHSPFTPSLYALEKLVNELFRMDNFFIYKTQSAFYGSFLLILLFLYVRFDMKLIFVIILSSICAHKFYLIFFRHHIDLVRIYFLTLSTILVMESFKRENKLSISLSIAITSLIHTIGAILSPFLLITYFIFDHKNITKKDTLYFAFTFLACGNYLYIYDLFFARGWFLR